MLKTDKLSPDSMQEVRYQPSSESKELVCVGELLSEYIVCLCVKVGLRDLWNGE